MDLFQDPLRGPQILYSSINSVVHLAEPQKNNNYLFDIATSPLLAEANEENKLQLGIWSLKFSGDGTQVLAGTTGGGLCLYSPRDVIH